MLTEVMGLLPEAAGRRGSGERSQGYEPARYFEDLQAVERSLPDCDWFEREEDRDEAKLSAGLRAGRLGTLAF